MGIEAKRFEKDVDEDFFCGICCKVLDDPVQTGCQHIFCKQCITDSINKGKNCCPKDQKMILLRHLTAIADIFKNFYDKLKITCPFSDLGCKEVMRLDREAEHRTGCQYRPDLVVNCRQKCGAKFTRREEKGHSCVSYLLDIICKFKKEEEKLTVKYDEVNEKVILKMKENEQEMEKMRSAKDRAIEKINQLEKLLQVKEKVLAEKQETMISIIENEEKEKKQLVRDFEDGKMKLMNLEKVLSEKEALVEEQRALFSSIYEMSAKGAKAAKVVNQSPSLSSLTPDDARSPTVTPIITKNMCVENAFVGTFGCSVGSLEISSQFLRFSGVSSQESDHKHVAVTFIIAVREIAMISIAFEDSNCFLLVLISVDEATKLKASMKLNNAVGVSKFHPESSEERERYLLIDMLVTEDEKQLVLNRIRSLKKKFYVEGVDEQKVKDMMKKAKVDLRQQATLKRKVSFEHDLKDELLNTPKMMKK